MEANLLLDPPEARNSDEPVSMSRGFRKAYRKAAEQTAGAQEKRRRKKVLIVDDEEDFVSLLRARLEYHHFEVLSAGDGDEGLRMAKKERPDIIVLDVILPGMGGYELCSEIRKYPFLAKTPVFMLSVRCGDIDRQMGLDSGASEYISKTGDMKELTQMMRKFLSFDWPEEEALAADRNARRVLIIDDNLADLKSMEKSLREIGVEHISLAKTGKEGIDAAFSKKPDLIIIDMFLPDLNGALTCRIIRRDKKYLPKIIIITGNSEKFDTMEWSRWGKYYDKSDGFLEKTPDYFLLQKAVRDIFSESTGKKD